MNDLGALPEVIADSNGGFTYRSQTELLQAMTRMLENRDERDRLGQNGYNALVKRWTTRPHLTQYYDVCAEIQDRREAA